METARSVERMRQRGEASLRPQRRFNGIAGRQSCVQRLAHGAKVADSTARHGKYNAKSVRCLLGIEIEQLAARRRGTEGADRSGRKPPAINRMPRLRGSAEFRHHF